MVSMVGSAPRRRLRLLCSSLSVGRSQLGGFGPKGESPDRWSLPPLEKRTLLVNKSLLFPPTGCSRADTLLIVHFVLFFTVFSASRQCCPGGGRGGAGTTVSSSDVFCLCPFALVFTVFFALSRSCFLHHLRFPSVFTVFWGFMTLLMLRCTLGWGGVGQSRSCELDHIVEASSCCWCYAAHWGGVGWGEVGGMLTFYVTCSRCWCYATLGWGGC